MLTLSVKLICHVSKSDIGYSWATTIDVRESEFYILCFQLVKTVETEKEKRA